MGNEKIKNVKISCKGFVTCRSDFYTAHTTVNGTQFEFKEGINIISCEIDDECWGICYILSMYNVFKNDFTLYESTVKINGNDISLDEFGKYSCYMDKTYPMFNSKKSVRALVKQGLKTSGLDFSDEDIRRLFKIDEERFDRQIMQTGNERFKAMTAIGYVFGKTVFCFPWLSKKRFDGFHLNLSELPDILESLGKIVIFPIGKI